MFYNSKSPETFNSQTVKLLEYLLAEQRHQRGDLATIKRQLHTIITSDKLQKQVDDYFDDKPPTEDVDPR